MKTTVELIEKKTLSKIVGGGIGTSTGGIMNPVNPNNPSLALGVMASP